MIDPSDVIKFDRTDAELEEWWLFSTIVAGKTAVVQARLLDRFLGSLSGSTPFDKIQQAIDTGMLQSKMEQARMGQYGRLFRCFVESMKLDLRNDPVEAFEFIHGVGPKTARMFIMHSRPNQRLAALDTHILKHLKVHGHAVPDTTPTGKRYRELELAFLKLADDVGMSPSEYDLMVWKSYARAHAET